MSKNDQKNVQKKESKNDHKIVQKKWQKMMPNLCKKSDKKWCQICPKNDPVQRVLKNLLHYKVCGNIIQHIILFRN